MSCIYVTEQGSKLSVSEGRIIISCKDGMRREIPIEIVESIMIFGNMELTHGAIKQILEKGISTTFLSTSGHYFGRLHSTSHMSGDRFKKQVYISDNLDQRILFARSTLRAKINNQVVLLRRYSRNRNDVDLRNEIEQMMSCEKKIAQKKDIEEIMGYEGTAARYYFQGLSKLVDKEFRFSGRSKRPPKDPFNSLLSLGYTILFYEIYAELENHNISPYISLVHSLKEHHPALVSDLLEEWRAIIVDSTVMSLVQGHEIKKDMFTVNEENGGVLNSNQGIRILVRKLEMKMSAQMNYLDYLEHPTSFRRGIWWQVKMLARGIDTEDLSVYKPVRIR